VASPIAHGFAGFWTSLGLATHFKTRLAEPWRYYLPRLGVLVLLDNLPDLDFLVELGSKGEYHRGFTHSLAAAVFVALALGCAWRIATGFWQSTMFYFTAYSSHLFIDLCTGTRLGWNNTGAGIPLFWPSTKEFSAPLILIFGVRHQNFSALFSMDNAWLGIYELLIFGTITAVVLACRALYAQYAPYRKS
jgi:membrane-bound metal-dependent hydrolase YbcI (DUF457 family)